MSTFGIGRALAAMAVITVLGVPATAQERFADDNQPNTKVPWRARPRVAIEKCQTVKGKTFAQGLTKVNKSGWVYENCRFNGPVRLSDCSSIYFKNCTFDLKDRVNVPFIEMFYTDQIDANGCTFQNALYDPIRYYAAHLKPSLLYEHESLSSRDDLLTSVSYSTKKASAFFAHHGGDIRFGDTKLDNVWVAKSDSFDALRKERPADEASRLAKSLPSWPAVAPYVFRFEGNTRFIAGTVTGADDFEGICYSPASLYMSHPPKISDEPLSSWAEAMEAIRDMNHDILLCDMMCKEALLGKRPYSVSRVFQQYRPIPASVLQVFGRAKILPPSKQTRYEYEIPAGRLSFSASDIRVLQSHFQGSWRCAFRLLYLCEMLQRLPPTGRTRAKQEAMLYAMVLLHGMHPARNTFDMRGPRYAGWHHSLIFSETRNGKAQVSTHGLAYQGRPLLSCSAICLWALSRAPNRGSTWIRTCTLWRCLLSAIRTLNTQHPFPMSTRSRIGDWRTTCQRAIC